MSECLWLRLYCDLPDNLKLRRLSESDQLLYIWLLCLHKRGQLAGATVHDIQWRLRLNGGCQDAIQRLKDANLLLDDLTPKGWHERQFVSDSSTERVQRYRMKRYRNVTETPSETETETDTEKNKTRGERADDKDTARIPQGHHESSKYPPPPAPKRPPPASFESLPQWLRESPGMSAALWDSWMATRSKKRACNSAHAVGLLVRKLEKRPAEAVKAIETAVERGWTGFDWTWFDGKPRAGGAGEIKPNTIWHSEKPDLAMRNAF